MGIAGSCMRTGGEAVAGYRFRSGRVWLVPYLRLGLTGIIARMYVS